MLGLAIALTLAPAASSEGDFFRSISIRDARISADAMAKFMIDAEHGKPSLLYDDAEAVCRSAFVESVKGMWAHAYSQIAQYEGPGRHVLLDSCKPYREASTRIETLIQSQRSQ